MATEPTKNVRTRTAVGRKPNARRPHLLQSRPQLDRLAQMAYDDRGAAVDEVADGG
jgi:hypothetical protein